MLFEDWRTRPVTPQNLHTVIWHRTIQINGWRVLTGQPIPVNENYANIITNLSDEYTEIVHNLGAYLANGNNVFSLPSLHFADARTHLFNGFFKESILASQMAIESTIRLIFSKALEQRGLKDAEIQELFEETPFMRLVKVEMPKILGGNWDLKKSDGAAGKWYQILYNKRNAIVHAGYAPYGHEANECFVVAHEFLTEIHKLIGKRKNAYPVLFDLCEKIPTFFLRGEEIGSFGID